MLIAPFRHCWLYCYATRNGMAKTRPVRALIATQSRLTRGTFSYSMLLRARRLEWAIGYSGC